MGPGVVWRRRCCKSNALAHVHRSLPSGRKPSMSTNRHRSLGLSFTKRGRACPVAAFASRARPWMDDSGLIVHKTVAYLVRLASTTAGSTTLSTRARLVSSLRLRCHHHGHLPSRCCPRHRASIGLRSSAHRSRSKPYRATVSCKPTRSWRQLSRVLRRHHLPPLPCHLRCPP